MKQSSKYATGTAALYCRLSRDDNMDNESNSIQNLKKILQKVAKEKGYADTIFFVDDGITGTTMKRPGFQKMIQAIEAGYISAVFVKDLSRLGRNYIEVGKLTEEFFPQHDIRLIAVSDGVDSDEGEDDFTPFRNIMNVLYCFSTVFANGTKAHHIAKSTCNHLAVRAVVTSAFSYSVLFIACCAVNARERTRAGEMYGYADK
ncbi:recombinase family protein [Intestinimonas butyriciproducens]|uniref:recombinase family protein n=2 Tax=Intestinimonas butyriciproducens TaxID=1297617 RepID=UPI001D082DFD|nr:recombinase family protein [Intestinimonas butyriciproducens]MCB7049535.1 recombinase family protein [Intestinimonas butyriciproducens]